MRTEIEKRADTAYSTLLVYRQYKGMSPDSSLDEEAAVDLVTDIFHFLGDYCLEPDELVRIALSHYEAETEEDLKS